MPKQHLNMTEELYRYLAGHSLRESEAAQRLREETEALKMSAMASAPEQSQFLGLLAQLMRAKRCIEVGAFTGYTTLWLAESVPVDGVVVCCDVTSEWLAIGERYWKAAGIADRIDVRIGPGIETLQTLLDDGMANLFDMVFVDADKESYCAYYELGLRLVRPGGVVAIDNVLWGGSVVNRANQGRDAVAVREVNDRVFGDERVQMCMLPIGDGLTLAMRRQ
jgi:predicted O-methyltransferase YrrM